MGRTHNARIESARRANRIRQAGESIESTESTMVAVNVQTLIDAYLIDFMPRFTDMLTC